MDRGARRTEEAEAHTAAPPPDLDATAREVSAMTPDAIDAELRRHGYDPERVAAAGAEVRLDRHGGESLQLTGIAVGRALLDMW